jgi:hypothetical protein
MPTAQDLAYLRLWRKNHSPEKRYQTAPNACLKLEKERQNSVKEMLSRTPEINKERRCDGVVFSGCGAGVQVSSFTIS